MLLHALLCIYSEFNINININITINININITININININVVKLPQFASRTLRLSNVPSQPHER
ncbi:hypothetical protein LTR85_005111 [Meristemomyces frigidus]|nr:hypothetical protein LTR85_005111 [Meristemomyces frigidus]